MNLNYIKINKVRLFILFLFSPILSLILSFFNFRANWSKNIVWAISTFYGFSFVISSNSTADSTRYAKSLSVMFTENWSLTAVFGQLYLIDGSLDLYQPIVTFFVSRFTDNYNILFSVFGFFFGYFYSRNIWLLICEACQKLDFNQKLIIFSFAFVVSISSGINGVRFYTATHAYLFGILLFFLKKDRRGLLFILTSFLFHWVFSLASLIFLFFLFAKRIFSIHSLLFLFIFTTCLSVFNFSFEFNIIESYLPSEVIASKTSHYLEVSNDYKLQSSEQSYFLMFYSLLTKFYFSIVFGFLCLFRFERLKKFEYYNFFLFTLYFNCISTVLSLVHDAGRFVAVSYLLSFACILLYTFKFTDIKFRKLLFSISPILYLLIVVEFRFFLDFIDFSFFFGNPFLNIFLEKGIPLGERF